MLDIKFIRENKDLIKAAAQKKHIQFDPDDLIAVDEKRRELLASVEAKRAEQNEASEKIGAAKNDNERLAFIEAVRSVKKSLQEEEGLLKDVMKAWQTLMVAVPNIPDMSVPEGDSDKDNQELKTWGEKPKFSFNCRSHIDLMKDLDLADFERGAKVAGFRGYILKNAAVLLDQAVGMFAQDHILKKGFTPIIVPSLLKKTPFIGTGYLPQGEEDL